MSDAMGTAAALGVLKPAQQRTADDAGPAPDALADASRRLRWTQAWDGAPAAPGAASVDPRPAPSLAADAAPAATRTLAEWRGRHARQGVGAADSAGDATVPTRRAAQRDREGQAEVPGLAQAAMSWPPAPPAAGPAQGDLATHGASAADEMRRLVESCCTRLLVAPASGGAAPGVMLDLGRWMPGCSIEVARAAGVLRLTLRGAAVERRAGLADGLDQLRDELSQSLGCPVVVAITESNDGSRR